MNFFARSVLVLVFLSLSSGTVAADSLLRLRAGVTTAQADDLTTAPGFTLGGALALTFVDGIEHGLSVLVELTLMPVSAPSRALATLESIRRLRHWSAIGRILRAVRRQGLIERIGPAPRVCEWHPSPELKRVIRRYVRRSR